MTRGLSVVADHMSTETDTAAANVPASHADLLERPVFAHLATVRPSGAPMSSVMLPFSRFVKLKFAIFSTHCSS